MNNKYFLMNSSELGEELINACHHGHLDIVKYLLTSPDLKEHADIDSKDNNGTNILIWACFEGHLEVAKYLIIEMNMDIDKSTMEWLEKRSQEEVYKLVKSRNLHNKLDNSIRDDKINNKKVKL